MDALKVEKSRLFYCSHSLFVSQSKLSLVEALLELGDSVEVMQNEASAADPLLGHYASLRSKIVPLDRNSERFALLSKYMHEVRKSSVFHFVFDVFCNSGTRWQQFRVWRESARHVKEDKKKGVEGGCV